MKPGIDPKVDYAFKKVFGSVSNLDLLQDLLEAVLQLPPGSLTAVTLLNPFNEKETADDKLSVLDIKARDASGRWFNVEMQMLGHPTLPQRVLYYWAKVYGQQLTEGEDYNALRPTVSICFLNSRLFTKGKGYHRRFALLDLQTQEVLTDHLDMHFFELPKFTLQLQEVKTTLEQWCYFFRNGESLHRGQLPQTLDRPAIHKALEVLEVMNQLERERYEDRLKWHRDQRAIETALEDARDLWRAEGLKEGRAEGQKEGLKEGLKEGQKSVYINEIAFYQGLLNQPVTPADDLLKMPLETLVAMMDELKGEFIRSRS